MTSEMKDKLQRLRADLVKAQWDGAFEPEVESALWTVKRALAGEAEYGSAVEYAINTLRSIGVYEQPKVAFTVSRTISKAEHDAMLGRESRGVDKEEYERMMREAQE